METSVNNKNILKGFALFALAWLLLQIAWGSIAQLYEDESYYFAYGTRLDWGYFDHPPMVALFSKTGYAIIPNEIGVRIINILGFVAGLWGLFSLVGKRDIKLFSALIFGSLACNVLGLLNLPDGPLFVFTVYFLIVFRRYLQRDSWKDVLWMILLGALMAYSKYHGVFVLVICAAANIKLLGRKSFWVVLVGILILFIPHVWWQYSHDFPSIKYHLFDRNTEYHLYYTGEYLLSQVVYYFPLTAPLVYWLIFRRQKRDQFEKTLTILTISFLLIFFVTSFKGHSEVNWTWPIFIPLTYFAYKANLHQRKWLIRLSLVSTLLIIGFKIQVLSPFMPIENDRGKYFRNQKEFVDLTMELAGDTMVVCDNYQHASLFSFYTGKYFTSINVDHRANQYSIWNLEDSLGGKEVLYLNNKLAYDNELGRGRLINDPHHTGYMLTHVRELKYLDDIRFEPAPFSQTVKKGGEVKLLVHRLPRPAGVKLYNPTTLTAAYIVNDKEVHRKVALIKPGIGDTISYNIPAYLPAGDYEVIHYPVDSLLSVWSPSARTKLKIVD